MNVDVLNVARQEENVWWVLTANDAALLYYLQLWIADT